jgi:ubiquinone/menaquinone biosynthesis C-methylase UbiE
MSDTPDELRQWEDNAAHWVANADRIAAITSMVSDVLVDRLAPSPGQRLLDVAAGVGDPSLRLARLVGAAGHVTASDGVRQMLDTLEQRAAAQGLKQVDALHLAAEDLDLPAGSYDGACSRFGVMFFSDPVRALGNMRRAVRPGGRLVVVAWGDDASNPFFTLSMTVLDELGVAPATEPASGKAVFEFAEDGALLGVAREAGWDDAAQEQHHFVMAVADTSPEQFLEVQTEISRKVRERVEPLDEELRGRVHALITERVRPYAEGGDIRFPATAMIITGRA